MRDLVNTLDRMVHQGAARGVDGWGYARINADGAKGGVWEGSPCQGNPQLTLDWNTQMVLINNRAMPCTEFYPGVPVELTQQPFSWKGITMIHNGIIANDKELRAEIPNEDFHPSPVDSAAMVSYLAHRIRGTRGRDYDILDVKNFLSKLKGSYALALADEKHPNRLYLATNYKPLSLCYDSAMQVMYFSSMENYIGDCGLETFTEERSYRRIPPYTLVEITAGDRFTIKTACLYPAQEPNNKVLVAFSGGLDSVVAAYWAKYKSKKDISLVHFRYGCGASGQELASVRLLARRLEAPLRFVGLDFLKESQSSLITGKVAGGEAGAEFAHEWVPARNLLFLAHLTSIAEMEGHGEILLGGNLEESGSHPDNEEIFLKKFDELIPNAVNLNTQIRISAPLATKMKRQIIEMGLEVGVPFEEVWSCYLDGSTTGGKPCGVCGSCHLRKTAFQMIGRQDPAGFAA